MSKIEVLTYGRNSDKSQKTSQQIQADVFHIHLREKWLADLLGGVPIVVEEYRDDGKSASKRKSKRHDFFRLMEDIKGKHQGKPLLVVNLSRLSRLHPSDVLVLFSTLQSTQTQVVSIDDRKIYRSKTLVEMLELLLKSNDNYEYARAISKNTLRGRLRTVLAGGNTCRTIPYGMAKLVVSNGTETVYPRTQSFSKAKDDKSYLVPGDALEVSIVRWVFETFSSSDISYGKLAKTLNEHANPLVKCGPTGRGWSVPTIRHMLANLHYNGWEYIGRSASGEHYRIGANGDIVESGEADKPYLHRVRTSYAPIITDELYCRGEQRMRRITESSYKCKTPVTGEGCPLTGLVICGCCGGRMYADDKGSGIFYTCRNAYERTSKGCRYWSVREDVLLPFMLTKLDKAICRKLQEKPPTGGDTRDVERERLQQAIAETDKAISSTRSKILATPSAADILTDTIIALGTRRDELLTSLASCQVPDEQAVHRAVDRWYALVQPMLVPVKTGNLGENDPVVAKLGIGDEVDRLFNYSLLRPSVIREQLKAMKAEVRLWFKEGGKGERKWVIDHGKVSCCIHGRDTSWNMESVRGKGLG